MTTKQSGQLPAVRGATVLDDALFLDVDEAELQGRRRVLLALCVLGFISICIYCPLRQHVVVVPEQETAATGAQEPDVPAGGTARPEAAPAVASPPPAAVAPVAPSSAPVATGPATLQASLQGGRLVLSGVVPNESVRAALLAGARGVYGDGNVSDQLHVSDKIGAAPYLSTVGGMTGLLTSLRGERSLSLEGNVLTLRGEVGTVAERDGVMQKARTLAPPGLRLAERLLIRQVEALQRSLNDELTGKTVEFAPNSADLTPAGQALLDQLLPTLRKGAEAGMLIAGHTDDQGAEETNRPLSQRRAKTVQAYLVERGVARDKVRTAGYGARKPIADNSTPAGRQKNRRIEFILNPSDRE